MDLGLFSVTVIVFVPFLTGIFLLAKPEKGIKLLPFIYIATSLLAGYMLFSGDIYRMTLEGPFGVELLLDNFAWTFVLMNGLVFLGVSISLLEKPLQSFAFPLMAMLHGTANAIFISYDLFNIFVCIELVSILAFLLIRMGNRPRQVWSAVQYLIVGNIGMILYLLGCLFAYNWSGSFSMDNLAELPGLPLYFLTMGLSVKGGVFLMGLWLPEAHGEAEGAISALLSGVIVKVGLAQLLRMASLSGTVAVVISVLAVFAALYGIIYALLEVDLKKILAYSSLSQIGFILAVPQVGHLYALAHGLFKSWLFLSASNLGKRDMRVLQREGVQIGKWVPLALGALALSGFPGLGGLGLKSIFFNGLKEWQMPFMYIAAAGSCIYTARLIFIPIRPLGRFRDSLNVRNIFYLGSIVTLEYDLGVFNTVSFLKSLFLIGFGWSVYHLFLKNNYSDLPKRTEELDNIVGILFVMIFLMRVVFG